tara:strand:- start:496 stop:741 length:246 start_codon:yes stop_codon:yes gene_type:complete
MKLKVQDFSSLLLRQKNMKIDVKDMKAHQEIIGDDTFKKDIKKQEKKKVSNLEDIFDKSGLGMNKKKLILKKDNKMKTKKK